MSPLGNGETLAFIGSGKRCVLDQGQRRNPEQDTVVSASAHKRRLRPWFMPLPSDQPPLP
jgi:hypothetical protein